MKKWSFTQHARERIKERYEIEKEIEIQKICAILDNKSIRLVKNFNNKKQIVDIVYGSYGEIQLVTMPEIKQVISVIPKTFLAKEPEIKKLKKQLNKFMEEEINIAAHIAREVEARMKSREIKINYIIDTLHKLLKGME